MMKKLSYILVCLAVVAITMSSCVSTKKIVYFQGSDTAFAQAQKIIQKYEMQIKPADQLLVKVTCSDPDLLEIFSQDVTMGAGGGSHGNYSTSYGGGSLTSAYGYTVDNDGNVNLPAVGKVQVADLTTDQAQDVIEKRIKDLNLIQDPKVTVRLMNARVTVIGAVSGPRVVSLTSERNSIVDVLAQCGDLNDMSLRKNIKLFRESNGERVMYELDMTSTDIFSSPAYYVQQNDMIYVEPNKSATIKSSPFYTFLSAGSSILATITAVISLIFLIKK